MSAQVGTVIRCADLTQHVYPTLLSVERQTRRPGDVVLVTDPSTPEGARAWIGQLAEARGYACIDAPDQRAAVVRNTGIGATTSPYVMCLDAGDALDPSFHEHCASSLDQHDDVHLVTTTVLMLGPGPERRVAPEIVPDDPSIPDALVGDTSIVHGASMVRRDTWARLDGFDESLACLEDYELFLRLLDERRRGIFIDQPLLIRAWRAEALYHRTWGSDEHTESFQAIVDKHASRFAADPVAALYPRERHLHGTAARYRELLARHNAARTQIDQLGDQNERRRERLPETQHAVAFGDLRRTSPIATDWGYHRGVPVDRYYIEQFIERHAIDVCGTVLEIQEPDYTTRFGGERVSRSDVVDLNASNSRATIISDMRCAANLASDTYDCLIITQTLHVVDDMPSVVSECARVLKPGGVLLATLPCTSRVCLEYGYGGDFWRVTADGARHVFSESFPSATLEIEARGNTLVSTAFAYGLTCDDLTDEEFEMDDPYNPTLVTVRAVKSSVMQPVKRSVTRGVSAPGLDPRAAILIYHGVGSWALDPHGLAVSEESFRAQVAHLRERYSVIPLADLSEAVSSNAVPPNSVALTFDDGYLDTYTLALPILMEHDLPATFFLTSDRLGRHHYEFWWDTLADCLLGPALTRPHELRVGLAAGEQVFRTRTKKQRLEAHWAVYQLINKSTPAERDYILELLVRWSGRRAPSDPRRRRMNAGEIVDLARHPGQTVGAHTVRHLMLPGLARDVQHLEMAQCKTALESLINAPVSTLAYPFGAVDDTVVEIARSVGFGAAVTCEEAVVRNGLDPLRLPRLEVTPQLPLPFDQWIGQSLVLDPA